MAHSTRSATAPRADRMTERPASPPPILYSPARCARLHTCCSSIPLERYVSMRKGGSHLCISCCMLCLMMCLANTKYRCTTCFWSRPEFVSYISNTAPSPIALAVRVGQSDAVSLCMMHDPREAWRMLPPATHTSTCVYVSMVSVYNLILTTHKRATSLASSFQLRQETVCILACALATLIRLRRAACRHCWSALPSATTTPPNKA